jgi:hypothetical protein
MTASPTPLFQSSLFALIASLFPASPPQTLQYLATLLAASGVTSIDDLANLVLLSNSGVDLFLQALMRRKGTPNEVCGMIRQVVETAKRAMAAE